MLFGDFFRNQDFFRKLFSRAEKSIKDGGFNP